MSKTMDKALDAVATLAPQDGPKPVRGPWQADYYPDHVSVYSDEIMEDYAFRIEFSEKMPEGQREATLQLVLAASEAASERNRLKEEKDEDRVCNRRLNDQLFAVRKINDELLAALELILPLAKGYRPEGQTDQARNTCNCWLEVAEEAIAKAKAQGGAA